MNVDVHVHTTGAYSVRARKRKQTCCTHSCCARACKHSYSRSFRITGFQVACNSAGTGGQYSTFNSPNCTTLLTVAPFTNGQCIVNPIARGAASVMFNCSAPAPPPPNATSGAVSTTAVGLAATAFIAALQVFTMFG